MVRKVFCLLVVLWGDSVVGVESLKVEINPGLLNDRWAAEWIAHPEAPGNDYGVFLFRRKFDLKAKPQRFVIHVSADNRYRLFVNGGAACMGPARGDLDHWRFETVDIGPFLKEGRNVLAAVVWNFGEHIPFAQVTNRTAFIVQGDSKAEAIVNTDNQWKVMQNLAYSPVPIERSRLNWAFIVVGPGDRVDASEYPWGWNSSEYDDGNWDKARTLGRGVPYGVRNFSVPWALEPRPIPPMEDRLQRIKKIALSTPKEIDDGFLKGGKPLEIPAHTTATILLDQTFLTAAYPELLVGGGKGGKITLEYAEALVDKQGGKGHRDEIEGREIRGYQDIFLPDGGEKRLFRPLWFRTYRYLQMEIKTADDPLTIHDFYGTVTGYPFVEKASFASSDPTLADIWKIGWRTAGLCAGETYYDCPYYEQLQYAGDTRIQTFISLYVSGDDRLMRNAIMQFDDSRIPEGLTASRYPHCVQQIIPPYSLFWIAMIHDHWMHRDDPEFVQRFLPGVRAVLEWFERHINETGMLGVLPWWNYVDWVPQYESGEPDGVKNGNSAIVTLQFVYALNYAAELADAFDQPGQARHYRDLAESLKKATYKLCWDEERGLLADTPGKKMFSQHTNIMAVLVDMIPAKRQGAFMQKVIADKDLVQCTFYYHFYLIRAMKKAGLGDRYIEMLEPWRDMLKLGLTTFAEKPEPTRSDCHAWSASPNYDLLATVCGIGPAEPGFKSVRIEPFLGPLKWVEGKMRHPLGVIEVRIERNGQSGVKGHITLPQGLTGKFLWKGKSVRLKSGRTDIDR
ncbi:MAG: alpha-L-rhamnosidase N-terminal domain-containing protein [Sedimentisphaerales bacterium]|nr:alpha-L-rhamnosidase N-terminal domain-containing protein [Sedimentisphaerales bacterium]